MIRYRLERDQRVKFIGVENKGSCKHLGKVYFRLGDQGVQIEIVFEFRALCDHGDFKARQVKKRCHV